MNPHVLIQVIAPHEPLVANFTRELFLARVRSHVTLELIRPGESLTTKCPTAQERPLTRVLPEMSAKVRCFAVDFRTPRIVANVFLLLRRAIRVNGACI